MANYYVIRIKFHWGFSYVTLYMKHSLLGTRRVIFIILLCLTRTGNYQIHEFDWLKRILTAVQIFPSRPAPRPVMFWSEKVANCFHLTTFISVSGKKLMRKKSKFVDQNLKEWNSAHRRSQAKWAVGTNQFYINELNCSCFCHITNILLTELSRSEWQNLDLGRYRPHCGGSVCTYDLGQDSPMQTSCSVNKS